jgi:hypothetical protein
MFVRGSGAGSDALDIRDGYIGEQRAIATRDATGNAPYMDPERITIYSTAGFGSNWRIRDNSVVKGSLYAPNAASLHIEDQSAVYGRVAATTINMSGNASVFYDPALDHRAGFTAVGGALYAAGRVKPEFLSLASLDSSAIQLAADATNTLINTIDGLISPTGYTPPGGGAVAPTDPTPRPVQIDLRIVAVGDALRLWE